ncbi:hypothetical protein [Nonomuraea sp. NPDC050783]|uniref:hypothetical protein n=1 Tax=Nonomuraea sp. NPDC050783 TaxID=3154634 RepID=UPI0034677D91
MRTDAQHPPAPPAAAGPADSGDRAARLEELRATAARLKERARSIRSDSRRIGDLSQEIHDSLREQRERLRASGAARRGTGAGQARDHPGTGPPPAPGAPG